jgi:hypothetical protein
MLLALASAVLLGSEFLGTRDHILLSQIWDFPFRRFLLLAGSRWRYSTLPPHGFALLAAGLQDNSSARTPRKTVAPLLRVCLPSCCIAMVTARTTPKTSYVIPSQRLHLSSDCCLATSNNIRNSIVAYVFTGPLPSNAVAIHVTICRPVTCFDL